MIAHMLVIDIIAEVAYTMTSMLAVGLVIAVIVKTVRHGNGRNQN